MISKKDLEYIANLSRVHLQESEIQSLTKNLEGILGYINKLNTLDVTGIAPTTHPLPLKNVMRKDIAHKPLGQEGALKITDRIHEGSFKVPKVIE